MSCDIKSVKPPKPPCIHKWIDMEDGSLDKFCVKCSHKAKQATMAMPILSPVLEKITVPVMREKITVHSPAGMIDVDKESFMNEFNKSIRLSLYKNGV